MTILQVASSYKGIPPETDFSSWVEVTKQVAGRTGEVTVRIVDNDEMGALNRQFRAKEGPTNVLSFPFEAPPDLEEAILGDVVICAQVVEQEASEYQIMLHSRWAHMTVHGVLHLCGYLHDQNLEAEQMEQLEKKIMNQLGLGDPYDGSSFNQHQTGGIER